MSRPNTLYSKVVMLAQPIARRMELHAGVLSISSGTSAHTKNSCHVPRAI